MRKKLAVVFACIILAFIGNRERRIENQENK